MLLNIHKKLTDEDEEKEKVEDEEKRRKGRTWEDRGDETVRRLMRASESWESARVREQERERERERERKKSYKNRALRSLAPSWS
jgi:hypothetical protein